MTASGRPEEGQAIARIRVVTASELSDETAQSPGMRRLEALGAATVGARVLWMGVTEMAPGSTSAPHHHGRSETGIYVDAGEPVFQYRDGSELVDLRAQPGDFVYVPPKLPHIESNPGRGIARVVITRTTSEAIVVNLEAL